MTEPFRVTVTLTGTSVEALEMSHTRDGLNKTDTINRALRLYAFVASETEKGNELWLASGGKPTGRVHLL